MTTVLLYSGGLDSYALAHIGQPDVLLHVRMGTSYGRVESGLLAAPAGLENRVTEADLTLALWERADTIIPARNAHLVLLAANYGETVWLAATAGDRVHDKDLKFADRMNELLAHLYAPQWWLPDGRDVRMELPAKAWSKEELVARYLAAGGDGAALARDTTSCYDATFHTRHCAGCKPCARKWMALVVNDVDPGYDAAPYVRATYLPAIRDGSWDRGRDEAATVLAALGEAAR